MSPRTYTVAEVNAEIARREAARKAAAGGSDLSSLVLDTSQPQSSPVTAVLDTTKPQQSPQLLAAGMPSSATLNPRAGSLTVTGSASSPPENPRTALFASHAPDLTPAMDTSVPPGRTSAPAATFPAHTPTVTPEAASAPPENPRSGLWGFLTGGQNETGPDGQPRLTLSRLGGAAIEGLKSGVKQVPAAVEAQNVRTAWEAEHPEEADINMYRDTFFTSPENVRRYGELIQAGMGEEEALRKLIGEGAKAGAQGAQEAGQALEKVMPEDERYAGGKSSGMLEGAIRGTTEFAPSLVASAVNPILGLVTTTGQLAGGHFQQFKGEGAEPARAAQAAYGSAAVEAPLFAATNLFNVNILGKAFGKNPLMLKFGQAAAGANSAGVVGALSTIPQEVGRTWAQNPDMTLKDAVDATGDNLHDTVDEKGNVQPGLLSKMGEAYLANTLGAGVMHGVGIAAGKGAELVRGQSPAERAATVQKLYVADMLNTPGEVEKFIKAASPAEMQQVHGIAQGIAKGLGEDLVPGKVEHHLMARDIAMGKPITEGLAGQDQTKLTPFTEGLLKLDQAMKGRTQSPGGVPFGPGQPAEAQPPQFTRQGLARLATGDLDAKDALYGIADAYGIKEPHRMEPGDLVDSIMSVQESRGSEMRRQQEAAQASADMQGQAEQARQDILAATTEADRLDAIKRFEDATTSLAQTPALPAGTQDFALVGEPTPRTMTPAQRDQMARQVMQPQPEWEIPGPEPQTERGMFDRENEEAFGGSIPYAVPNQPVVPPMNLGARRYLETRAQGLDSAINEAGRTGSAPDAKLVGEREAIGRMLSEDDAARVPAQQTQEASQVAQAGSQAVLPGEAGNDSGQTPNAAQGAATAVQAPPATPESFARTYGIPETPEFLDAIRQYQEITGEGARGPATEPQPAAGPAAIPAEGSRAGMESSPQGQTVLNLPGQEARSTEPVSPLPAGSVETPMVEKWLAPVRERLASHINLKVVGSPEEIPIAERARLAKADPNWMRNAGAATKDGSYILAWNLGGDRNEVRALATHEVKHQAMFRMFERMAEEKPYKGMADRQMAVVLDPLIKARQGEIATLGRQQYGEAFDPGNPMHMLVGASEWLANAKNVEPRAYEKFMAAVRAALRSVGEKLDIHWLRDLKMSDAEIKTVNARIMREALQPDVPMGEMPGYADLGLQPVSQGVPAAGEMVGFRRGSESVPSVIKPAFEDPAVEARFREAAKGIGDQRGILERGKTWLGEQAAGFTRHFIHMPNIPEYAEAHEALRQLEAAPTAAKEEAVRNLRAVTGKLSPGAYDLFTRKVILDDLAHEASLGHDLPFGFTPETLAKEKAKLDRWAENVPEVKDALATRKTLMDDLTGKLVDAGILSEDQVKNPAYFRHEVLKYAREWQQSQGTGSALKKPRPGYAKGREGSTEDISANYLESEYSFMQRAMVDLKTAETLEKIKGRYDVMPDVKAAAQEANARALATMGMDAKGMTEGQKREALGGKYKTWENLIPEGYDRFQADKGLVYHTGNGITDRAMLSLMDALQMDDKAFQAQAPEVVLDVLNGVRQQLMVGGKKPEMILPKPIAETLNNMRPKAERSFFDQALAKPLGLWKQWVLVNPRRVLKYNLNNMAGDLDAVLAGNPKALARLPEAIRELRDVMKGGEPSQDYRDAVARGVFDSGLSVQEIPDVAKLDAFHNLAAERSGKFSPMDIVRKGWRALQDYTQFRENWMRLAAYKDYLRRIEAGEDMRSIGYGASDPKIVDALSDPKDKAAMLARTLVGDYGAVSHYGQGLRNKVIPFYSWMEVNAKRYAQLMKNAFDQGIGQGFKTAGLTGAMLGARASVYLGLRMAAMYGLISTYNHLFHGDEEESLSPLDRQQLHVILGKDKDGNVHTLRLQGALSDFLDWFGFSDAVGAMREMQNGRGSYGDVLKAVAKAPVNKIAGGITPFLKTPLELAMGQSTYPDVFNPRPMQDRAREAARLFSAENEYDALMNKPTRGYWQSWLQAVDYTRNVGEIAFNNTMDRIREFKESKGIEGAGSSSTPKSRVIREYKQALRYGDENAAQAAMEKMQAQGVTPADMEKSLIRSAPLSGLARKDRAEFLATLTPKEQDQVKAAEAWYKDTFLDTDELKTRYDFHELEADYNLATKQKKELLKAGRHAEAHDLAVENGLGKKAALIARVHELKAGRKKVEEARRLSEDERAARLGEYDKRILAVMRRALSAGAGNAESE